MSINYSCWEFWTDGRAVNSLSPQDGGLLKCICGKYFLNRQAESGSIIYNPLPPPPKNWESEEVWSGFLRGGQSRRDYLLAKYDFRPESEREQERLAKPPEEMVVKDEELVDLLASGCSNSEVLMVARRRYWRYLNDEYRKSYRKHIKLNPDTYPIFSPSQLQRNNMLQLIQLIEIEDNPDYLELAELHRQLGNFEAAFEVVATKYQETEKQQELGDLIANLIFYKKNQPYVAKMNV
jgi:hypothetical protein